MDVTDPELTHMEWTGPELVHLTNLGPSQLHTHHLQVKMYAPLLSNYDRWNKIVVSEKGQSVYGPHDKVVPGTCVILEKPHIRQTRKWPVVRKKLFHLMKK